MLKGRLRTLTFLLMLCGFVMVILLIILYRKDSRNTELQREKSVLIDRLAEEVKFSKELKRENDSLRKSSR